LEDPVCENIRVVDRWADVAKGNGQKKKGRLRCCYGFDNGNIIL